MSREERIFVAYETIALLTTVYLLFFTDHNFRWWSAIFIVFGDLFLAHLWPIYWLLKLLGLLW